MTEERILAAIEAEGLTASRQSLDDFYQTQVVRSVEGRSEAAVVAG